MYIPDGVMAPLCAAVSVGCLYFSFDNAGKALRAVEEHRKERDRYWPNKVEWKVQGDTIWFKVFAKTGHVLFTAPLSKADMTAMMASAELRDELRAQGHNVQ